MVCRSCIPSSGISKPKTITVVCLLGLAVNYFIFVHCLDNGIYFKTIAVWTRNNRHNNTLARSNTGGESGDNAIFGDHGGGFGSEAWSVEGKPHNQAQTNNGQQPLVSQVIPTKDNQSLEDLLKIGEAETNVEKNNAVRYGADPSGDRNKNGKVLSPKTVNTFKSTNVKVDMKNSETVINVQHIIRSRTNLSEELNKTSHKGKGSNNLDGSKDVDITSVAVLINETSKTLPTCPEKPKELVGSIKTYLKPIEISKVEANYPEIRLGGNYHPPDCKPSEKLALVIPCRNRSQHLHILLNNLLRVLIKQKLDFTVFVIDQDLPTTFNRGMLFNVGYLEALKRGNYTCFIFHDVDMVPTNDNCLYKCSANPRHFLAGLSKWQYRLPYEAYYGGIVSFTKEQFKKINGGSNLYFGWGGEDDDFRARVVNKGYSVVRYPKMIGRYDTVSHKRDKGNEANEARFDLNRNAKVRQDFEGLSTTKYKLTEFVEAPLFTKIKVHINETQILRDSKQFLGKWYKH